MGLQRRGRPRGRWVAAGGGWRQHTVYRCSAVKLADDTGRSLDTLCHALSCSGGHSGFNSHVLWCSLAERPTDSLLCRRRSSQRQPLLRCMTRNICCSRIIVLGTRHLFRGVTRLVLSQPFTHGVPQSCIQYCICLHQPANSTSLLARKTKSACQTRWHQLHPPAEWDYFSRSTIYWWNGCSRAGGRCSHPNRNTRTCTSLRACSESCREIRVDRRHGETFSDRGWRFSRALLEAAAEAVGSARVGSAHPGLGPEALLQRLRVDPAVPNKCRTLMRVICLVRTPLLVLSSFILASEHP